MAESGVDAGAGAGVGAGDVIPSRNNCMVAR